MRPLNLMVYRHSAFYSPILAGIGGGFFERAGFAATYTVMPPGRNVGDMIASGEIHVSQASVSTSWAWLDRGGKPPFTLFATLNRRDGFLVAARRPDPDFRWEKLLHGGFLHAHGGQPQAMLAYALHRKGIDLAVVRDIDRGDSEQAMAAFAAGEGDYFHEQAPYPQQLAAQGKAFIVASIGDVIGPVAFSGMAASPAWLAGPDAAAFLEGFRAAREWVDRAPATEVAAVIGNHFPAILPAALAQAVACYQALGCWSGPLDIPLEEYEKTLEVFEHSGQVTRRHAYDEVVTRP